MPVRSAGSAHSDVGAERPLLPAREAPRSATTGAARAEVHRDGFVATAAGPKPPAKVDTSKSIASARQMVARLQEKDALLQTEIAEKKNSLVGLVNSKTGLVESALTHGNVDLVALLASYERGKERVGGRRDSVAVGPRMTNEQFLVRSLQHLTGQRDVSASDWCKVETRNRLGQEESPFNLREGYRKHLGAGKEVYRDSAESRDKLKELEKKRSDISQVSAAVAGELKGMKGKADAQEAKKGKTDQNIGKLVKGGKQNQTQVNRETQAYIELVDSLALLKAASVGKVREGQTLQGELRDLGEKIKKQLDQVTEVYDEVYLYEKKLALFEAVLGHDLERLGGDDMRVHLIKAALTKSSQETNDQIELLKKEQGQVKGALAELSGHLKTYDSTDSTWDRYWAKRKVKDVLKTARVD